jgi:hypothetical protein
MMMERSGTFQHRQRLARPLRQAYPAGATVLAPVRAFAVVAAASAIAVLGTSKAIIFDYKRSELMIRP